MIQGAINKVLGTAAAVTSVMTPGGRSSIRSLFERSSQADAQVKELQQARLQQQQKFDKLKEDIRKNYSMLGTFGADAQKQWIRQDPDLQKKLLEAKRLEEQLNGKA